MEQSTYTSDNISSNLSEAAAQTKLSSFLSRDLLKDRRLSSFINMTVAEFIEYFDNKPCKRNKPLMQVYDACLNYIVGPVVAVSETPVLEVPQVIESVVFPLDSWRSESLWFQLTRTVDAILSLLVEKGAKRVDIKAKRAIKYFQGNMTFDEIAKTEDKEPETIRLAVKRDIVDKILDGSISEYCLVDLTVSQDFINRIKDISRKYLLQDTTSIEKAIGCPKGFLARSNYKDFFEDEEVAFSKLNCRIALCPKHTHDLYQLVESIGKQLSLAFAFQSVSDFWKGIKEDCPKIAERKEYTDFIYHWLSNNPLVETDGRDGYRLTASALTIGYVRQARIIYDSEAPLKLAQIEAIHNKLFGEMSILSGSYLHDLGFICTDYHWHHPMSPNHSPSTSIVA